MNKNLFQKREWVIEDSRSRKNMCFGSEHKPTLYRKIFGSKKGNNLWSWLISNQLVKFLID